MTLRMVLGATALATLLGGPAAAQYDSANSGPTFWLQERERASPRQRAAPAGQRVRRLMPHREFARPTILRERPVLADRPPVDRKPAPGPAPAEPGASGAAPALAAEPGSTPGAARPPLVVAVVGDGLAAWLATGLADAFAPGQDVSILARARDSSGLVRDDFYDWPKALRDLLAAGKVDAVVVMIGSNDRQPLRGAAGADEPLSPAWREAYGRRVEALASVAKEKRVPVLWVGMPSMRNERYSRDVGAINDLDRVRAEAAGARFIDVYDAFSDEKGQYSAFGPDINGQIVKLRSADGVHFTAAGARKLAHFVEGDLRRLREASLPAPEAPAEARIPDAKTPEGKTPEGKTPEGKAPDGKPPDGKPPDAQAAPKPDAGPTLSLSAYPAGGGLIGEGGAPRLTDADRAAIEANAGRPAPGRADDPAWPKR